MKLLDPYIDLILRKKQFAAAEELCAERTHRVKAEKAIKHSREYFDVRPGESFFWNEALVLGMPEYEFYHRYGRLPDHIYVKAAPLPRPVVVERPSLLSIAFAPVHWTVSCLLLMASLPVLAVVSATTTAYNTTCAILSLPSTVVRGLQCMADVLFAAYW